MAKAADKPETLRVLFAAHPPAELVAGDVTILAGDEGELPADQARELAANPAMQVVLLDEELPTPAPPTGDLPGVEAHVNPQPADTDAAAPSPEEK